MAELGTRSCYQTGCEHPECAEANREYAAERRRLAGVPERAEGRTCGVSGYMGGHHCEICRAAYRDYRRAKRAAT